MNTVLDCGHGPSPHEIITTGYGQDNDGKTFCYECCAAKDRASMIEDGRATLYLTKDGDRYKVSNWPGSLRFDVDYVRKGRHNIAGCRYDVWFTGPDGRNWHGVQYGEQTQILHCRAIGRVLPSTGKGA